MSSTPRSPQGWLHCCAHQACAISRTAGRGTHSRSRSASPHVLDDGDRHISDLRGAAPAKQCGGVGIDGRLPRFAGSALHERADCCAGTEVDNRVRDRLAVPNKRCPRYVRMHTRPMPQRSFLSVVGCGEKTGVGVMDHCRPSPPCAAEYT